VDSDALNVFLPFRRLEPNHENQLTRALLVMLRLCPMARATWLRLVAPDQHLQQLPVASFRTQTRSARDAGEDDEPADLVSVFLAPEAPLSSEAVITESDRDQVLDAVIDYDGEVLIVVENKVAEDDLRQARELNVTGATIHLEDGQEVVVVVWRDVLEAFIALRERNLVAGTEAALLDDFLLYTEDYFPDLGPFRTLALAHGNLFRQNRRLRQLLGEAVGLEAVIDGWGPYVDTPAGDLIGTKTYLPMTDDREQIRLAFFPADTLSQARAFYSRPAAVAGVTSLAGQPGWHVEANFHFGHMQRGYCWTTSTHDPDAYIALWEQRSAPPEPSRATNGTTTGPGLNARGSQRPRTARSSTGTSRTRSDGPPRPVRGCPSRAAGRSPTPKHSTVAAPCTHKSARRSTPP
jgi:hypothetical protein